VSRNVGAADAAPRGGTGATVTARPTVEAGGRRAEILSEAAQLFAERGFLGVSIDEIGAAVGITGPGIYRHFAGKEALLGEILISISERLLAGARERCVIPDGGAELDALLDFHVDFALSHPELITVQDRDFHNLSVQDARRVRRLQRSYVELWVGAVQRVVVGLDGESARAATQAVFGLLNSTPHSANREAIVRDEMAALLHRMARSALDAAAG
jgi:AcrR family transcriptional regulator